MTDLGTRVKKLFRRENLPKSRAARITLGVLLVLFGLVGFLPVLGFWMVPVGLAILAIDIPIVRRLTRKVTVGLGRWWKKLKAKSAATAPPARRPPFA
jgi:hypothetical protein